ncbi:hypothetical protein H6G20_20945 [Desertifilum sp. FACHB-1129]|uniref:Tail specific protease domain-containing protein n=2 Tax=Desertifilum tharense IPPAS B-1220 TaxID=1781255 RepID=A0A1E5QLA5_9CYAN|nr:MULTISPECIES: S41 family peptidase [Desertifilum]MDA0211124.1 S41 family peptidase [Cyanobacteria bacterium FC1]MBD2314140.1 hypothetical protein [Desertifilum sp. FACHB-1129]MBD2320105.1 hypothetical protein [Desertifilum sp. FACHB-866]MBD2330233.1 hypothetical protein [Desertifilum sp. FACHB-868]OEJ75133.1 hypothetical protein BH720_10410 [Desertifilum tharense IPPAS B-1220]
MESIQLEAQELQNIEAFCRLLGILRYFHPSTAATKADWNQMAVSGIQTIKSVANSQELAIQLEQLLQPIAPTLRVLPKQEPYTIPQILFPSCRQRAIKTVRWKHLGMGTGSIFQGWRWFFNPFYKSQKEYTNVPSHRSFNDIFLEDWIWQATLPGNLVAYVPLVLFTNFWGTFPQGLAKPPKLKLKLTPDDWAVRLADVAIAWNAFQHFYPYFDVVSVDWQNVLPEALQSAATSSSPSAYLNVIKRMVALLQDGHGQVIDKSILPYCLPLTWVWIENQIAIAHVLPEQREVLHPGDVVVTIDNRPVAEVAAETEQFCSGSPQLKPFSVLMELLLGEQNAIRQLTVRSPEGELRDITVVHEVPVTQMPQEPRLQDISELKPGIFYVNLELSNSRFSQALQRLQQAQGIIFDLRGYPRSAARAIQHLIQESVESAQWLVPILYKPDRKDMSFEELKRWQLPPRSPYLKANRVFLVDGRAMSQTETWLGIIDRYKLGDIVGSTTAGTNGNMNGFRLPSGITILWTGMKVYKHDGSQHHLVGFQPTVAVSRTIQGVRDRKDELVERAIEVLQSNGLANGGHRC